MHPIIKASTPRTRRKFDETFQREAVRNWLNSGRSAAVVAKELGLGEGLLFAWRKLLPPTDAGGKAAVGGRRPAASDLQVQSEIFNFIEAFYNRQRRHTSLEGLSPADFELKNS